MVSAEYERFLARHGYPPIDEAARFYREMFVEVWFAAGFHRFWRQWSPLAGFVCTRLYRILGGRRSHARATLAVFTISGLFHDLLLFLVAGGPQLRLTIAWIFFGVATLVSARFDRRLGFRTWPRPRRLVLNLALLAAGIGLGGFVQTSLLRIAAAA